MQKQSKINTLLQNWPKNTVAVYSWLKENGISKPLIEHYKKSGWVDSFGVGAFVRKGDEVNEFGALYALQNYLKLPVHIGGYSAFYLSGTSHYVRWNNLSLQVKLQIFNKYSSPIPSWFKNNKNLKIEIYNTDFLEDSQYLTNFNIGDFSVKISSPERAILEVLYLCPKKFDLIEAFHLVENLVSLRPKVMQNLLENCKSIKVKRLACFLFEKVGHEWFKLLDLTKLDFGSGNRKISDHGFYDSKYKIIIPKELRNGN